MDLEFAWYAPIDGDGRFAGTTQPELYPTLERLTEVIQTAERVGFTTPRVSEN